MTKTSSGRFFEDFELGQVIHHATPRTIGAGDRALVAALYPGRFALTSSELFAHACGLPQLPFDELAAFHVVFGKSVPDISLNAVANLGYAEGRILGPVYVGDTLSATSEVIGLRETSKGDAGVVYVRTTGLNQRGRPILRFARWVLVNKRDAASPAPEPVVPELAEAVTAADLALPFGLHFRGYDARAAGSPHLWDAYGIGERIDHPSAAPIEEVEHMMATRLWQNTARVHFDPAARGGQPRLVYGGHVISLARALSFDGLENAQMMVAINAGTHAGPCVAGDRIRAWSEVLDKAETAEPSVGAVRLRLVAAKNRDIEGMALRDEAGRYSEGVVLDFDYWALMPR